MSAPDTHAPFAPSGLARVVACPGSYNLIRAARAAGLSLNEDDTDASREGTAAHEVAQRLVQYGECIPVGSLTSNGVAVTEEMVEGAQMYAEAVAPYLDGARIEEHVECMYVHRDCHGTPDFAYGPTLGTLFISDYKFGHRYVSPEMNWQLIAYAIGSMPSYLPTVKVILQIVQPRSYHRDGPVREWVIDGHRLRDYAQVLMAACDAAEQPDAQCTTSPQCYECPARHVCEAALHMEQSALYLSGSTIPLDASVEAKAVRLRQIRRAADHLKQMESGITEDLTAAVRRGVNVPGFTLQASAGREVWVKPVEEIVALGVALGVDLNKPGCITPNQARKAGLSPDIVAGYANRPSGAVSLVEDDGTRLAAVFGGVR
jgi:hypothetical protein